MTNLDVKQRGGGKQTIYVVEESGDWSIALRACGKDSNFRVSQIEGADALDATLRANARCFTVIERDAQPDFTNRLAELTRRFPLSQFVAATDDDEASAMLFEAGATWVATCRWRVASILQLASQFFEKLPTRDESVHEHVWNRLPWQDE